MAIDLTLAEGADWASSLPEFRHNEWGDAVRIFLATEWEAAVLLDRRALLLAFFLNH